MGADQTASSYGSAGSGTRACCSLAWNTASGCAPPNGRHERRPATSKLHPLAASTIACRLAKVRPAKKLSHTYGIGRATLGLSLGFRALAGSISVP